MLRAIIIGVIAALAICAPANAAITFNGRVITVPPTCVTGASCATTLVGTVTANTSNNDLVIVRSEINANQVIGAVTDSKSHTWTCFTQITTSTTTPTDRICYAFMGATPLVVADTITAHFATGTANEGMYTAYVSGVDTVDLDVAAQQQTATGPSPAYSGTTNFAAEFVLGVYVGNPTSFTADATWTTIDNNSSTTPKGYWAYRITAATGSQAFAPTNTSVATVVTMKSWYPAGAASVGASMTTLGVGP